MTNLLSQVAALRETARAKKPPRDRPRHHMEAIMQLKTREERAAALEQVPAEIRHIVRFYCEAEFAKRHRKPLPDLERKTEVT